MRPKPPLELRMSLGWMAEAWTFTRRCPGVRVGLGRVSSERMGGESGDSFVSRRPFIVVIL